MAVTLVSKGGDICIKLRQFQAVLIAVPVISKALAGAEDWCTLISWPRLFDNELSVF